MQMINPSFFIKKTKISHIINVRPLCAQQQEQSTADVITYNKLIGKCHDYMPSKYC